MEKYLYRCDTWYIILKGVKYGWKGLYYSNNTYNIDYSDLTLFCTFVCKIGARFRLQGFPEFPDGNVTRMICNFVAV